MAASRKAKLRKLARLMNKQNEIPVPVVSELIDCFDLVITEEEADFLIRMGAAAHTFEDLAKLSGKDADSFRPFLESLCKKGLVWFRDNEGGPRTYILAAILVGWFELTLARGRETPEEKEFARRLTLLFDAYKKLNVFPLRGAANLFTRLGTRPFQSVAPVFPGKKKAGKKSVVEVGETVAIPPEKIYPTSMVFELVEKSSAENALAVMHCFCRQWRKMENEPCRFKMPIEACMIMGDFARYGMESGFARPLPREEALEILEKVRKAGGVHLVFHERDDTRLSKVAICNCCWDCCGVIGSHNRGILPLNFQCYAKASVDEALCNGCGACEKFCPTQAVAVLEEKARLKDCLCIGCGQCAAKCPTGAASLSACERKVVAPMKPVAEVRLP